MGERGDRQGPVKPLVLRSGLIKPDLLREVRRPLELDLEATFKAMRDDVMRELIAATRDGATPEEAIRRIDAMLGED